MTCPPKRFSWHWRRYVGYATGLSTYYCWKCLRNAICFLPQRGHSVIFRLGYCQPQSFSPGDTPDVGAGANFASPSISSLVYGRAWGRSLCQSVRLTEHDRWKGVVVMIALWPAQESGRLPPPRDIAFPPKKTTIADIRPSSVAVIRVGVSLYG